ncbi:MAG: hypothetical protein QMD22_06570 [archaeon]|nr:hypothetical protein [archaeon]
MIEEERRIDDKKIMSSLEELECIPLTGAAKRIGCCGTCSGKVPLFLPLLAPGLPESAQHFQLPLPL